MSKEYNDAIQKYFVSFLLSSNEAFARSRNILKSSYFDAKLRKSVKYILDYADKYKAVPTFEQVQAETNVALQKIEGLNERHTTAFLDEIELFCRHKAMEEVIYAGPDLLAKGQHSDIEKMAKEAVLISLQRELGTNYFEDPRGRLERMRAKNGMMSTGWKTIDEKLYGGLNRGEITIFAGSSGAGKSLFLQNIALNWVNAGLNVMYITCELSEDLVSMRIDSMITGVRSSEIFKKLDDVELKVNMAKKGSAGNLWIKYMPAGTTSNDLRAYLKEFMIQTNITPDALCVDYLDLLYPNNKRVNPSDLFVKDKFVSEELRALAAEFKVLCVSASQLNRTAIQEQEHDQSMIAGGLSKINTADNVMTIFTSDPMRERGEYRIQFIKTRSSAGVGSKITLAFDPATLRITDPETAGMAKPSDIKDIASELAERRKALRVGEPKKVENKPVETLNRVEMPNTNSIEPKENKADAIRNLLNRINNN